MIKNIVIYLKVIGSMAIVSSTFGYFAATTISCAQLAKESHSLNDNSYYSMRLYNEAEKYFISKDYAKALPLYAEYVQKYPATQHSISALMGLASSLHNVNKFDEAVIRWREVIAQGNERQVAQALLSISYSYEALGANDEVVAVLRDAQIKKDNLPPPVWRAEIPARLAAAYARLGAPELAERFLREAEDGLMFLRKNYRDKDSKEWLGQTLFRMGSLTKEPITSDNFFAKVKTLNKLQDYLIQATELDGPWAELSKQELITEYRRLWDTIVTTPLPDNSEHEIAERLQKRSQRAMGEKVLESLTELRSKRLPAGLVNSIHIQELFMKLGEIEKQIYDLITKNIASENGLTVEAQKAEQLRREGTVTDPAGRLELKSLPKSR